VSDRLTSGRPEADQGWRGLGLDAGQIVGYARSASDLFRLTVLTALTLLMLGAAKWADDAVVGLETDFVELFSFLSRDAERLLAGLAQLGVLLIVLVVFLPLLLLRRWRLVGYLVVGLVAAGLLTDLAASWLARPDLPIISNEVAGRAGVDLQWLFGPEGLARTAAAFIILAPFVTAAWRRAGMVAIALLWLTRLLVVAYLPAELFTSLALGGAVGSAVLLAFGRPVERPTPAAVERTLASCGLAATHVVPMESDARASVPSIATLADGTRLFVKSLSPRERSADLLFRLYRFARFKNLGDERPFSSLRRAVEHEALVSLQVRDVGARTPRLRAIAAVQPDSMVLAFDLVDGSSMDDLPDEAITDDLLLQLWRQVVVLQEHRIAHRDLRQANVFVSSDGEAWLIDFGFSEVAASQRLLDADIAQLLAALAIRVGPERAVEPAIAALGAENVGACLHMLQPSVLGSATVAALKLQKGLLEQLRSAIADRAGIDEPTYVSLDRFSRKRVLTGAAIALVTYVLVPQLADLPGIIEQLRLADWAWFVPVLLMSLLTYVGAAMSMQGAVASRLPMLPTFLAQFAGTFANRLAPAFAGGVALSVRYLQRSGIDTAVAASGVGLSAVASIVVHLGLLALFAVWAGRSTAGSAIEEPQYLLIGLAVLVVLGLGAYAVPSVRRAIRDRVLPVLRRSLDGVAVVLRRPSRVVLLLGGATVVTVCYLLGLFFAIQAFGGGLSLALVGVVYLAGSGIAAAVPTPGGLGAVEAALIAGLVAAGLANPIAVPAVFMFRLATFWLPILPGWLSFTYLQKREYL
jgi:undecaprenyl-diphosphatase